LEAAYARHSASLKQAMQEVARRAVAEYSSKHLINSSSSPAGRLPAGAPLSRNGSGAVTGQWPPALRGSMSGVSTGLQTPGLVQSAMPSPQSLLHIYGAVDTGSPAFNQLSGTSPAHIQRMQGTGSTAQAAAVAAAMAAAGRAGPMGSPAVSPAGLMRSHAASFTEATPPRLLWFRTPDGGMAHVVYHQRTTTPSAVTAPGRRSSDMSSPGWMLQSPAAGQGLPATAHIMQDNLQPAAALCSPALVQQRSVQPASMAGAGTELKEAREEAVPTQPEGLSNRAPEGSMAPAAPASTAAVESTSRQQQQQQQKARRTRKRRGSAAGDTDTQKPGTHGTVTTAAGKCCRKRAQPMPLMRDICQAIASRNRVCKNTKSRALRSLCILQVPAAALTWVMRPRLTSPAWCQDIPWAVMPACHDGQHTRMF